MPIAPPLPCNFPGCPKYQDKDGYCLEHLSKVNQSYEATRETAVQRGYTHRWHKIRKAKLNRNPLCEQCDEQGIVTEARLVHHKDRNPKNMANDNLMSLCKRCHDLEHKDERWNK